MGRARWGRMMNRACWLLVDLMSHMLDPRERSVVRGDLEEMRATGASALREIVGLVGRRQILAWTDWRPWLAVGTLIVPLGAILNLVSRSWAYTAAIYSWLYVNNWTRAYLESPGSRIELMRRGAECAVAFTTLASWSWTTGFALASLSRRAIWTAGGALSLVLLGTFVAAPEPPDEHTAVFALTFYRVAFPVVLRVAFLVIPSLWGMRAGVRQATLPMGRALVCASVLVVATASTVRGLEMSAVSWLHLRSAWLHLVPAAVMWPACYILFGSIWRLRENRTAAL